MRRPPILPMLMAAMLAACGTARDQADTARQAEATLANMQASLAAVGGTAPVAPPGPLPGVLSDTLPSRAGPPQAVPPARPMATLPDLGPSRAPDRRPVATVPETPDPREPALPLPLHQGQAPRAAAHLLGQGPDHLRLWLGEPTMRRAEGHGAEVWLYAVEACALDLVLYRDRGGRLRVAFAAARAAGERPETGTEAECLGHIAAGPAARPAT